MTTPISNESSSVATSSTNVASSSTSERKTHIQSLLQHGAETGAAAITGGLAKAYAPWIAFQVLQPTMGSAFAYYTIGEMVKSGGFALAGPVGAACGVVAVKYGPPLLKWTWNQGYHLVQEQLKDRTQQVADKTFEPYLLLDEYARRRDMEEEKRAWDDFQLGNLRDELAREEKPMLRRTQSFIL